MARENESFKIDEILQRLEKLEDELRGDKREEKDTDSPSSVKYRLRMPGLDTEYSYLNKNGDRLLFSTGSDDGCRSAGWVHLFTEEEIYELPKDIVYAIDMGVIVKEKVKYER